MHCTSVSQYNKTSTLLSAFFSTFYTLDPRGERKANWTFLGSNPCAVSECSIHYDFIKTILKSSEPYFVAGIDRGVFLDFSAGRPFRVGRVVVDVLLLDLLQQQEAVRAARLLPDLELGSAPLRGWSRMIGLKQNPI